MSEKKLTEEEIIKAQEEKAKKLNEQAQAAKDVDKDKKPVEVQKPKGKRVYKKIPNPFSIKSVDVPKDGLVIDEYLKKDKVFQKALKNALKCGLVEWR